MLRLFFGLLPQYWRGGFPRLYFENIDGSELPRDTRSWRLASCSSRSVIFGLGGSETEEEEDRPSAPFFEPCRDAAPANPRNNSPTAPSQFCAVRGEWIHIVQKRFSLF